MTHFRSLIHTESGWKWPDNDSIFASIRPIVSNIGQTKTYIRKSIANLDEKLLWKRATANTLSIGNLIMHVRGTEHQWIGHYLGGIELFRDRELEMTAIGGMTFHALMAELDAVEQESLSILTRFTEDDWEKLYTGHNLSAEFILHYTAQHLAYHAGQLVYLRKLHESSFQLFE